MPSSTTWLRKVRYDQHHDELTAPVTGFSRRSAAATAVRSRRRPPGGNLHRSSTNPRVGTPARRTAARAALGLDAGAGLRGARRRDPRRPVGQPVEGGVHRRTAPRRHPRRLLQLLAALSAFSQLGLTSGSRASRTVVAPPTKGLTPMKRPLLLAASTAALAAGATGAFLPAPASAAPATASISLAVKSDTSTRRRGATASGTTPSSSPPVSRCARASR